MKKLSLLMMAVACLASACVVYDDPHHGPYRDGRDGGAYRGDRDGDGVPNRADRDRDGDGIPNRQDNRPNQPSRY
jgi:hypothetical protein